MVSALSHRILVRIRCSQQSIMKMKIDLSQWIHRRRTEIKTRESLLNNSVSLFQTVTKKLDPYWLAITTTIVQLSFDISPKISRQKSLKIAILYSWHPSYFPLYHALKMECKDSSGQKTICSLFAIIVIDCTLRDRSCTLFVTESTRPYQKNKNIEADKNPFSPQ